MSSVEVQAAPRTHAYSVKQAAAAIGRSDQYVRNLITNGDLAAKRDGRVIYVMPSELDRFLNSRPDA